MKESIIDFAAMMKEFSVKYPTYEVVVCNCIDCRSIPIRRETSWAVNHAEKKIYL